MIVRVDARGHALSVDTLDDPAPGLGFPDAARSCAMRQRYRPARDWHGREVAGRTGRFGVQFFTF